ncbi:g6349 [Coccomyxa elongata]
MRELELLADEQETVEEGEAVVAVVNSHKRRYQALQKDFREASLEVQKVAARKVMEERKALLGSANPLQRAQQLSTQADLANSATDTTASLQRTRQLMAEELDHTSATLAALEVSSATLKGAADEYGQQHGRIKKSHKLLGTMRRASVWDSLTLWGGAAIFFAVVAFIVYKRLAFFVPAALVPNLGALMHALPAFGLANLTSGLHFWSPPPGPPPGPEVDVDGIVTGGGLPDTDAGMEQWRRWAAAPGQQRAAEDAASARGREGVHRELADVEGVYKEGGSADEWPDPSDPAYVEPAVRYAEQLSPAEVRPAEAAATAHPGYAGFGGMQGSAMVANEGGQNGSTTGTTEEVQSAETLHVNASQPADAMHANATSKDQDLAEAAEQDAAAADQEAASEEVLEEEAAPLPVDYNVTGETLPSHIEQPGSVQLPDSPAEDAVLPSEAADSEEEMTDDSAAEAAASDASTGLESAAASEQQDEGPGEHKEEPAAKDILEGLPQDILGGAEQEAEIAHRHAAPHFAEEVSRPVAGDTADSTDEQAGAATPDAKSVSEGSAQHQVLDEERAVLDDILAATPGFETVTAPVSDVAEEVPLDTEKLLAEPTDIATEEVESSPELSATAGEDIEQEVGVAMQEDFAGDEADATGEEGELEEGVSETEDQEDVAEFQRAASKEPLMDSRDRLDAGMLYQRLSREGHEAAQRSSNAEEGGAGHDVLVDTEVPVDREVSRNGETKMEGLPDREL